MGDNHTSDNNLVMSRDLGSTNTIVVEGESENGKTHQFNEQTNYVPKRAIITVCYDNLSDEEPS
jgi:hypothetical protein